MDYIEVVDQEIFAYHGVLEEEKVKGQYFYVSFKGYLPMEEAADEDNLTLSVSYADMCQTVKRIVTEKTYDLIETLAHEAAMALLLEHPLLKRVVVTVKKPSAPVGEPVAYPGVTVDRCWHMAYISVGSNKGNSVQTIEEAMKVLGAAQDSFVDKMATIIETEPWGKTDQATFYNSAFSYKTVLSPKKLMARLLQVEKQFGREREVKWGPRTLDLDLILYDDLISDDPYVIVPHPLMEERAFVLEPLCEIAPNVVHPILGTRIFRLLELLK